MFRSISSRAVTRIAGALPAVLAAILLAASPAAAWGGQLRISGYNFNAFMRDNQLVLTSGAYLHTFYDNDQGPTYRRTALSNVQSGSGEFLAKLTAAFGDAEGIAADSTGERIALLYRYSAHPTNTLELRMSNDHGTNWSAAVKVAHYSGNTSMGHGSVAISGQTVLVAWSDLRNGHVNLRRSTDGGAHFGAAQQLATTMAHDVQNQRDGQIHLAASGSNVVAIWNQARAGLYPSKLVIRRSVDGGATFKTARTLDAATQAFDGPSVAMSGSRIFISHASKAGHVGVLRSVDGGKTFTSKDVSGTKLSEDRTDITLDPGNASSLRVVWSSNARVYLRRSSDAGLTWTDTEDTLARGLEGDVISPNVIVSGGRSVVVWNAVVSNDVVYEVVAARTDG